MRKYVNKLLVILFIMLSVCTTYADNHVLVDAKHPSFHKMSTSTDIINKKPGIKLDASAEYNINKKHATRSLSNEINMVTNKKSGDQE